MLLIVTLPPVPIVSAVTPSLCNWRIPEPSAVWTNPLVDVLLAFIMFAIVYNITHFCPDAMLIDTPLAILIGPTLTALYPAVIAKFEVKFVEL